MRRLLLLTICAMLVMGTSVLMQCSTPLELDDDPIKTDTLFLEPPHPFDTIIDTIIDTVFTGDTVFVFDTTFDTTFVSDTVFVIDTIVDTITDTIGPDTIIIIDTIFVPDPDSGGTIALCVTVSPKQHMINWMLLNSSGDYSFEWTATVSRDRPCQTLIVEIDGQQYMWDPYAQPSLDIDQTLGGDVSVKVFPEKPSCFGHAIDLCVTITKK